MRLNKLSEAELVRYFRLSFKMLTKYQSTKAWYRHERIVVHLEQRGMK